MQKKHETEIVKKVKDITKLEGSIADNMTTISNLLANDGIAFKDAVKTVCGMFKDWPRQAEDTTRSKKGDVVSLSSVKTKPEHADFLTTETFQYIRNFERNWRRYFTADENGVIAIKAPAEPKEAKEKRNPIETIKLNLEKELNKLKRRPELKDIAESLELTIAALTDYLSPAEEKQAEPKTGTDG